MLLFRYALEMFMNDLVIFEYSLNVHKVLSYTIYLHSNTEDDVKDLISQSLRMF